MTVSGFLPAGLAAVVALSLATTGRTDGPLSRSSNDKHEGEPLLVAGRPEAGFHQPYLLLLPPEMRSGSPILVVLPTPPTSSDPADYLSAAQRIAGNTKPFLARLRLPILVPVLPRPPVTAPDGSGINLYIPSLSREALLTREPGLARMDLQVLAMVGDARERIRRERRLDVQEKAIYTGFSAAGHFATRMAVLHPGRTLAVWSGGTGGHPILPAAEHEGRRLTYPVGVADLEEVAGTRFDGPAFARVPMLLVQGAEDSNSALPIGEGASDSYSSAQAQLVRELFGRTALERLEKVRLVYRAAGSPAEFRVYPGARHEITPQIAGELVQWVAEQVKRASGTRPGE